MSHTKHANTLFPGEKVKISGQSVNKIASSEEGKVIGADADSGRVNIDFGDGRTDWVELGKVEKVG